MGTYGRFNTHNVRVKQLKHEKTKRYKNILFVIQESGSINNSFKKVDKATLKKIKLEIKTKANKKKRLNNILHFLLSILVLCFMVMFVNWTLN